MPAILVDWLQEGEIPVFTVPPDSTCQVVPVETETKSWQPSRLGRERFWVPIDEFEVAGISDTLTRLLLGVGEDSLVIVTFRTYDEAHGYAILGIGSITPCPTEIITGIERGGGPPRLEWPFPVESRGTPAELPALVLDAIRGRGGRDTAHLHPVIQAMYSRLIAKREDHQRRLDWDRDHPDSEMNQLIEGLQRDLQQRFERGRLEREENQRREGRARSLLLETLTEAQAASLQEQGFFELVGGDGRRYRIRHGFSHNVFLLDEGGNQIVEYCIVTESTTPLSDNMLAQKLMLEACPDEFHRIANFRRRNAA